MTTINGYDLGPLPTIEEKAASEDRANTRTAASYAYAVVDALIAGSYLESAWWDLTDGQRAETIVLITHAIKGKLPATYGDNLRRRSAGG